MSPILAFVVGLLIGWLVEWVIDWLYWRRKNSERQIELDASNRVRISELEQEVASYKNQLAVLQEEISHPALVVKAAPEQAKVHDHLEDIPGVTEEMAQRLNVAGIFSFLDLGALRPQRLKELVGDCIAQPGNEVEIIKRARLTSGMMKKPDDLEVIVGIGPVIARMLNNAGIFTFAELSALTASELRAIVGERIQRLADEEEILAHARQLAEETSQGG